MKSPPSLDSHSASVFKLLELSEKLDAQLIGDPECLVTGIAEPLRSQSSEIVVLLHEHKIDLTQVKAQTLVSSTPIDSDRNLLLVSDPRHALSCLLHLFHPEPSCEHRISARTEIASSAQLTAPVEVGAFTVIGEHSQIAENTKISSQVSIGNHVEIGANCRIGPRVVIGDRVHIGQDVVIHAGAVIGADGYGFYLHQGQHTKIPQVGSVIIEDRVEIGANTCIDRGTISPTRIGEGTKIDNLVQIGHNVQIGKNCLIVSQAGISGSCQLGDQVILAGQSGVAGHLQIGDGVIASGKSGITRNLQAGEKVGGFPAQSQRQFLKTQAALRDLPDLIKWWKKTLRVSQDET